jgi:hypothetical protein
MLHATVASCDGLISQNRGDSFLVLWKLTANSNDIAIIEAMLKPEHLKSQEAVIDYFQAAVAEDMAKYRAEQIQQVGVLSFVHFFYLYAHLLLVLYTYTSVIYIHVI